MGGAGHVVPPPKATQGALGILMPLYTIGIVMIFVYTMMKVCNIHSEYHSSFSLQPLNHKVMMFFSAIDEKKL